MPVSQAIPLPMPFSSLGSAWTDSGSASMQSWLEWQRLLWQPWWDLQAQWLQPWLARPLFTSTSAAFEVERLSPNATIAKERSVRS